MGGLAFAVGVVPGALGDPCGRINSADGQGSEQERGVGVRYSTQDAPGCAR